MKKNVTVYLGLIQAFYWMGFATFSSFSSVYLLEAGLNTSMIGAILSIGAFLSAILQPMLGNIIDKYERITVKKAMFVMSATVTVIPLAISIFKPTNIFVIAVLYSIGIMILMLSQPFTNALGIATINSGYKLNLGVSRSAGSLWYALTAYVVGEVTVRMGTKTIPVISAAAFLLLALSSFIYPVKEVSVASLKEDEVKKSGTLEFLKKYKAFSIMLLSMVFIYFGHVILNSFSLQIIVPKGGSSADMGLAAAISAMSEIVVMSSFNFLKKKFKLSTMLKWSGVFYTLKVLGSLLTRDVYGYYAVQVFQMLAWAVMAMSIIFYVNELVDETDRAKGQAYAGTSLTIGNVLGNLFGGTLIDKTGINTTLIIATAISLAGTIILWIFTKDVNGKENENGH